MNRLVKDWVFWVFLYLAAATSICLVLVELQNIRSIHDRARLNEQQDHIRANLKRLDERSEWLEGVVKKAIDDDRRRREARSKGQ